MSILEKLANVAKKFSNIDTNDAGGRNKLRNVIAFYGVAENTGTTSLLYNVAEELHSANTPVCILCLDFKMPTVWRYVTDEVPDEKTISNKLRNPTLNMQELCVGKGVNDIAVITMSGYELPADYAEVELYAVKDMIEELCRKYSYVLIDAGTDLNSAATMAALVEADKVYTCVRPVTHQMMKLLGVVEVFESIGYQRKIYNVIQCQTLDNAYTSSEYAKSKLNLIGNIPFSFELSRCFDNYTLPKTAIKKELKTFNSIVKLIASEIVSYIETSYTMDNALEDEIDTEDSAQNSPDTTFEHAQDITESGDADDIGVELEEEETV